MLCTETIDEVDVVVYFCLNDPVLNKILHEDFYDELLSDELVGPLEHYARILYDLVQISKIGHRYKQIPDNCCVHSLVQLDEVLDVFYSMDTGRKDVIIVNELSYPSDYYLETPTFLRKAFCQGVWFPKRMEFIVV